MHRLTYLTTLGLKSSSLVLAFGVLWVAASVLDPASFGIFAFMISAARVGTSFVGIGFPGASLRWPSKMLAEGTPDALDRFFVTSVIWTFSAGILVLGMALVLPDGALPMPKATLGAFVCIVLGFAVNEVTVNLLRAHGHVQGGVLLFDVVFRVLFVACVLAGLGLDLLNSGSQLLVALFWIYCFSIWFSVLVGLAWLALAHGFGIARPDARWAIWRNADLRAFWGLGFVNSALAHSDVILAGFFLQPEIVGIYAVAKRISLLISFFLVTANFVTATKISKAHTLGDMAEVQKQLKFSLVYATVPALFSGLVVFALKVPIMTSFTSAEALGTLSDPTAAIGGLSVLFGVMLLTQIVNCAFGSTGLALAQMGAAGQSLRIKIVTLCLAIAGVTIGTHMFGVFGTALGFFVATVVQNAWLALTIRRGFGVDPSFFVYLSPIGRANQ